MNQMVSTWNQNFSVGQFSSVYSMGTPAAGSIQGASGVSPQQFGASDSTALQSPMFMQMQYMSGLSMNVTGSMMGMQMQMMQMMQMQMMQMMMGMQMMQMMQMMQGMCCPMPMMQMPMMGMFQNPGMGNFNGMQQMVPQFNAPDFGNIFNQIYHGQYSQANSPYKPSPENNQPVQYPRFHSPNDDASTIQNAVEGIGTNEDAVFRSVEGRNPQEITDLRQTFQDRTGVELGQRLREDLNPQEMHRASSAMNGQDAANSAHSINNAVTGLGTDEAAVFNNLEGKDRDQITRLRQAYQDQYGTDLGERLREDLNSDEMHRASSAMNGQDAANAAGNINQAVSGFGTDEEAVFNNLEGRDRDQIARTRQAYQDQYGVDLGDRLRDDLNGQEMTRASSAMNGRDAANSADTIANAVRGWGTDEDAIYRSLEGKTPDEISRMRQAYRDQYGVDVAERLRGDLNSREMQRASNSLNGREATGRAAGLNEAMSGWGTDEAGVFRNLEGRTREEISAIRQSYQDMYGTDLASALRSELSGADLERAMRALAVEAR